MRVVERPSLKAMNSFGVAASAALLLVIESEEDVLAVPPFDPGRDFVLGGGSNVVLATDVPGAVYHNAILGREVVEDGPDYGLLEVGAGENWHDLVRWTLEHGYSGLENLSLIPGLAGAAPLQNIGAYGVELASVLERVTAWDWQRCAWASFSREDCRLGYRDSLFKSGAPDRYLITSIRLRLHRVFEPRLDYAGLREELSVAGIAHPTALDVSDAVMRIRRRKLPDPALTGNAGSFFKNPVVDAAHAEVLLARHPGLPAWPAGPGRTKLSAAWMVEQCGLKGLSHGDAAVSRQHALVLINRGAATGGDIIRLSRRVQSVVASAFGVALEPEPRLVEFQS
ncbi:MAG: UDP-N-acetylmuramate dehydrogenase [Lysobacterales bacterium]|nr:MAG: UDP-N-acetylmuramate dehydrogenase [Xanthomonadales bacterium]